MTRRKSDPFDPDIRIDPTRLQRSLAGQTLFLGIARAEGAQKRVWKTDSSAFVLTPTNFLVGVKLLKA